jgi:uncharacterized protein YwgA
VADQLLQRMAVIAEIVERKQGRGRLGKTAMQKLLYLLQEGYGVDIGYRFDLYTYGPYASRVMSDLDYARNINLLAIRYAPEEGYEISLGSSIASLDSYRRTVHETAGLRVEALMSHFGDMNAKELELHATVYYVLNDDRSQSKSQVISLVQELKPKFEGPQIEQALDRVALAIPA